MNSILEASLLSNLLSLINESSSIDRESLKEYCQGVLNIQNPSPIFLRKIETYYHYNHHQLPEDLEEFAKWNITSCLCGLISPDLIDNAVLISSYIMQNENRIASCHQLLLYLEYFKQENRIPSPDELIEYVHNLVNLQEDPERFHQENKMKVPTPNLHLLTPSENCKEDNCGLCFESIQEKENCFKLPCNHIFHCEEENCLNTTIKTWLSQNKCCPICKTEVILQ